MRAKFEGEEILRNIYSNKQKSDCSYTIIRPGGLTIEEPLGPKGIELVDIIIIIIIIIIYYYYYLRIKKMKLVVEFLDGMLHLYVLNALNLKIVKMLL